MKKLEESDIIRIMREEWDAKVAALAETVEVVLQGDVEGKEKTLISKGLKVWSKIPPSSSKKGDDHDRKGYLYTVYSVSPNQVELETPEGETFPVSKEELESSYILNVGERKDPKKTSDGDKK